MHNRMWFGLQAKSHLLFEKRGMPFRNSANAVPQHQKSKVVNVGSSEIHSDRNGCIANWRPCMSYQWCSWIHVPYMHPTRLRPCYVHSLFKDGLIPVTGTAPDSDKSFWNPYKLKAPSQKSFKLACGYSSCFWYLETRVCGIFYLQFWPAEFLQQGVLLKQLPRTCLFKMSNSTTPWLDTGDNAWQLTAGSLVALQSVPGLVVL